MADGASYDIDINAKSNGVETSASELDKLASSLDAAGAGQLSIAEQLAKSEAEFSRLEEASIRASKALDQATNAAASIDRLSEASSTAAAKAEAQAAAVQAAKSALEALQATEDASASDLANANAQLDAANAKYMTLQIKAEAASRALQKASSAAANIDELKAAADAAAEAVSNEAKHLDELKAAAEEAAPAMQKTADSSVSAIDAAKGGLGPMGGLFERLNMLAKGGWVSIIIAIGAGLIMMAGAAVLAVANLAKLAVTLNKVAMAKIDKITKKAQDNFAKLFSGVHVDKFVKALDDLSGLLDQSSSSAKGLKLIFETLLNPIFDAIAVIEPYAKEMFKGMVLGLLILAIVVVTAKNALMKLIPPGLLSGIDWMETALNAGIIVIYAIAAAAAIAAAVFVVLAAVFVAAWVVGLIALFAVPIAIIAVIVIIGLLLYALYRLASEGWDAVSGFVSSAIDSLSGFGEAAMAAGGQLIQGLLDSISSGSGMVLDALRSLGSGAINALKGALGIHSPSKYAIEMGANLTSTMADTVEKGTPDVKTAMASMVDPPDAPSIQSEAKGAAGSGGSSSSKSVSVSGNTFSFYGVKDADDAESRFGALLTRIIEGDVTSLGGEVPA